MLEDGCGPMPLLITVVKCGLTPGAAMLEGTGLICVPRGVDEMATALELKAPLLEDSR
jgi:hypothetical protein